MYYLKYFAIFSAAILRLNVIFRITLKKLYEIVQHINMYIASFFADDNYTVGLDFSMSMEVRPRSLSGVLSSVYNPTNGEYLVLQMINGDVVFSALNERGEKQINTTFRQAFRTNLCDGNWHTIRGW